jgi:hypothetical protein
MGAATLASLWLPFDGGAWNKLLQVVIPGGLALVVYFGALKLLRVHELEVLYGILRRRRAS